MNSRAPIEDSLRRIEERVAALEKIKDPAARLAARQLFEAILDLHGLALAKITTKLTMSEDGRETYAALGADEQVKAVLLLYGLHPDSAEDRIRAAIAPLEARLDVRLHLISVGDGIARITLEPGIGDFDALCQQVGRALIDAAPDLDDIAIDRAAMPGVAMPARAAAAG
jgi:hypothetical protein